MDNVSILTINPSILKWAREETGFSSHDIAERLNVDENQYIKWETSGSDISFADLKQLSAIYKLQIATFFLPYTPKKHKKPTDYRNINFKNTTFSLETSLAIRRTNKFRDLLIELNGQKYYELKYEWLTDLIIKQKQLSISDDVIIQFLRQKLGYSINDQVNDKTFNDSYRNWRNVLENELGVHVFQFSLPKSEVQGFCYTSSYPFSITVNSKYPVSSRIFTLFHELGHILNKQSGLCVPDNVSDDHNGEFECNSFAGKLLLPSENVIRSVNKDEIFDLSRHFKVSSEVYLRRIKSLNLISESEFFSVLREIRKSTKPTKPGGRASPRQKSINSRGLTLFNNVLEAVNKNRISYERAADALDLKINYLLES